jgi:hypothetical protein
MVGRWTSGELAGRGEGIFPKEPRKFKIGALGTLAPFRALFF